LKIFSRDYVFGGPLIGQPIRLSSRHHHAAIALSPDGIHSTKFTCINGRITVMKSRAPQRKYGRAQRAAASNWVISDGIRWTPLKTAAARLAMCGSVFASSPEVDWEIWGIS
jgi:hypothetical protein